MCVCRADGVEVAVLHFLKVWLCVSQNKVKIQKRLKTQHTIDFSVI